MRDISDRFRLLRQEMGMSQDSFGERIGMSRSEVKNIEYGITSLKERSIPIICREFYVNETWLRTGEGDMFIPKSRDAQIMDFVGSAMMGEATNFQRKLLAVLARLSVEEWELIEKKIKELAEEE